jgi:hypothetical protein
MQRRKEQAKETYNSRHHYSNPTRRAGEMSRRRSASDANLLLVRWGLCDLALLLLLIHLR